MEVVEAKPEDGCLILDIVNVERYACICKLASVSCITILNDKSCDRERRVRRSRLEGGVALETIRAIHERRSVRRYASTSVQEELITRLIDAATWAPSGGNAQTWRFVVVRDRERIRDLRMVSPGLPGPPPCVVVICQDVEAASGKQARLGTERLILFDSAMAAQNLLLAAHDLGLGACVIASFHSEAVRMLLGMPDHVEAILLVSLGWPLEEPEAPPRAKEGLVFYEHYGAR